VLADDQRYAGWCVLVLKEHEERLDALPVERQGRIFLDVARIGKAMAAAFSPDRLNFECLGNQVAHVHWHVIPRYRAWDPDPGNTVWVRPLAERATGCAPERRLALVAALRRALAESRE
jgi:diadenosine tetraphosphate (Ap4A) HIT family hydrolase